MEQELTVSQARSRKLPDTDPYSGEEVVWAPILAPAERDKQRALNFEAAAQILGGGRAA